MCVIILHWRKKWKLAVSPRSSDHQNKMYLRELQLRSVNINWTQQFLKNPEYLLCGHLYNWDLSWRQVQECVSGCKVTGCSGVTHGQLPYPVSFRSPGPYSRGPVWHNPAHQATKTLVVLGLHTSLLSSAFLLVWPIGLLTSVHSDAAVSHSKDPDYFSRFSQSLFSSTR